MKRLDYFTFLEKRSMKRMKTVLFTMTLLVVFPFSNSFSNNLSIANISYSQAGGTVTFDLSWDNSWRKSDWVSKNWDAAWVFVKWRDCSSPGSDPFVHGVVSTTTTDHNFNVNSGATTFEPTLKDGTVGIDASPNNTGVMLRNAADLTTGTVSARVTLKVSNLPSTGTLDLRVFGIEMVFAVKNPFMLGDGTGTSASTSSFTATNNPSSPNIFSLGIVSENAVTVFEPISCSGTGCLLVAGFQKGYNAFYVMKYEISQGQYADFLNAISSPAQSSHYPGQTTNRHTIVNTGTPPQQYFANRPDRACNYLSWSDVSSYCDWAALRPLTELEYEKTARGIEPASPFQKAWGTTTGTVITATGISGAENGTETVTTANANICSGNITFTSPGDGGLGPVRDGIFATGVAGTRMQTGTGFYGAMELSGNVLEFYASASFGTSGIGLSLGDGVLDVASGNHNNATWPSATTPSTNIIRRGGSWLTASGETAAAGIATNVSYRGSGNTATRDNTSGGRGGR